MTVAHLVIAIIVIPLISGLIKGWSSTCKRTNYLTSLEMSKARFPVFNSEYETNAEMSPTEVNIYEHNVSSPESISNENEPVTFTASEIPDAMNGSLNELFLALSSGEESPISESSDSMNSLEQVQLSDEPELEVDSPHPMATAVIKEMNDEYEISDEMYFSDLEEPEMIYENTDEFKSYDSPNELQQELAESVKLSLNLIQDSLAQDESIDEMLESLNKKNTKPSNVVPFPTDIAMFDVPLVIPKANFDAIERRYGSVIANSITTTPEIGGSGSSTDVMVGRIGHLEEDKVLQYGDHQVIIKGKGVSGFQEGQAVLIKGQFVNHSLFIVAETEDLEQYQCSINSNIV
ncbi:hypothetical protein [Paenibacillus sp. FSL P4-0288]|uniref:hypothetical protein n=1 Tax=Paenibacillus sp. FSL P4-0288 TaxID=2921633 RepID=UPI0030F8D01E